MVGVSSGWKKWRGRCIESFQNAKETAPTKLNVHGCVAGGEVPDGKT